VARPVLTERRPLGRDIVTSACVWCGGPAQRSMAAIRRPGPRQAKGICETSGPLRLRASALIGWIGGLCVFASLRLFVEFGYSKGTQVHQCFEGKVGDFGEGGGV